MGTAKGAAVTVNGRRHRFRLKGFSLWSAGDQMKSNLIIAKFPDGRARHAIAPVVRKYDVQPINGLPEEYVSPPPEMLERIKRENV